MENLHAFNGVIRNAVNKSVLIISDTHFPYAHPDTIPFLAKIKEDMQPDLALSVGDEVDGHAISFHKTLTDTEIFNASAELEKAIDDVQDLNELFPKLDVLESNHGSLIYRRLVAEGIPLEYLKPLPELYGVKWRWHEELILKTKAGPIYICHGKTGSVGKLCKEMGMSAVQGHFHGKFCVNYFHTPTTDRFDMYVGCLINYKSRAFDYGKNHLPKPILGVGWIAKDGTPSLIKMKLNESGRWTKKL